MAATINDLNVLIQSEKITPSIAWNETDKHMLYKSLLGSIPGEFQMHLDSALGRNQLDKFETDLLFYNYSEPNYPVINEAPIDPMVLKTKRVFIKPSFITNSWNVNGLLSSLRQDIPIAAQVNDAIAKYFANHIDKLIASLITSLSKNADIVTGDGTANLTDTLINDSVFKRGEYADDKKTLIVMSPATLKDILDKQVAGTIAKIITNRTSFGLGEGGISTTLISSDYWLHGQTPVIINKNVENGLVCIVYEKAFGFVASRINPMGQAPIEIDSEPEKHKGAGQQTLWVRTAYVIHPHGFSFKGVKGTDYAAASGPSRAEYEAKNLFDLIDDVSRVRIFPIKVKIG